MLTWNEVAKIDATESSFYADVYLSLHWRDDRIPANATFDPTTMFWPSVEFTNRLQREALTLQWVYRPGFYGVPHSLIPPEANDSSASYWTAYTRASSTFITRLQLADFPQDYQNVTVRIESPLLDETQVGLL